MADAELQKAGWVLVQEPYRRFVGPAYGGAAKRTLIPAEHLTDDEAWQRLRKHVEKETVETSR